MQVYLVGGAVRDELLGLPVRERDWVVVGATPAQMVDLGYLRVGRDFPVFLHPETKEEYALARLERKTGPGYRGFQADAAPSVTLEEDLLRRDLTINAIARSASGQLIDPYGGERDLRARALRHVSPAFIEDPVRVLRVARFAARFAPLGFSVAPDTAALMHTMVASGEVDALVPERVWRETERALACERPDVFFDVLTQCGALARILPGLSWTESTAAAVRRAAKRALAPIERFAVAVATMAPAELDALCARLRVPGPFRDLARLLVTQAPSLAQATALDPPRLLTLLEASDAFRRPERFEELLRAFEALRPDAHEACLRARAARAAAAAAKVPDPGPSAPSGPQIAVALRAERLARLAALGPATASASGPEA